MSLAPIVELYRACGRPQLEGAYFACVTDFLPVRALLTNVQNVGRARFDEIEVDGVDLLGESLPEHGNNVKFRLGLPAGSSSKFHNNLSSLLDIEPQISRGVLPTDYYLIEEDYYSDDQEAPEAVEVLGRVCRLIIGLSELAHYHDGKPSNGYLRLVFIQPEKGPGIKPVELETRVSISVVMAAGNLDPRLVEELSATSAANDPHHSTKVGVFGTSLATFIARRPTIGGSFEYLVQHWQEFVAEYHRDLGTYLSGFAFHKAKTEVAEAELKIADEFSKVLNDITGKLLGIPVTLAVALAIPRATKIFEHILLLLGVLIASFIMSQTVANQQRQFRRISNAKELVIGAIEGKKSSYPEDLAAVVEKLSVDLKSDEDGLRNCLRAFRVLTWLPLLVAFGVLGYVYQDALVLFLSFLSTEISRYATRT